MNGFYKYIEDKEELHISIISLNAILEGKIHDQLQLDGIFYKKIKKVWIDFISVNEFNSLAISELITLNNKFKKYNPDIEIHLINVKPQVNNILQLVDVNIYFKIHTI